MKITQKVGNGTLLSEAGTDLLNEFRKYQIQIEKTSNINIAGGHISSGLLESIKHPFNINVYSSSDEDAFRRTCSGVRAPKAETAINIINEIVVIIPRFILKFPFNSYLS